MTQMTTKQDDAKLLDFVRQKLNSFVKWDLVRFFHDNPFAADTAENIARYTGREPFLVQNDLGALAQDDIVAVSEIANRRVYRLSKDAEVRELIGSFVRACDDREFRARAIQEVIEGLR
jgi:hypothetical protein